LGGKLWEKKRPIEIERARKSQPEVTLNYFRLILHVQALCQIHRRIASGMRVENWIMEDGLVTRTDDRGNDPLQERLEYVPPELHLNADEKPLLPDSPVSKTLTFSTEKLTSIASGRTKSWTVHMFIRANGVMDIPRLVIMRGDSISSDILEAIVGTNIQVTATLIGASKSNPAIIEMDGHIIILFFNHLIHL